MAHLLSRNKGYHNEPTRPIMQSIDLYFFFPSYSQFIIAINTLMNEIYWSIMISWHSWPEAEPCNLIPSPLSSTQIMPWAWLLGPKWHLIIVLDGGLMVILLNRGMLSEIFVKWFKIHSAVEEHCICAFGLSPWVMETAWFIFLFPKPFPSNVRNNWTMSFTAKPKLHQKNIIC